MICFGPCGLTANQFWRECPSKEKDGDILKPYQAIIIEKRLSKRKPLARGLLSRESIQKLAQKMRNESC